MKNSNIIMIVAVVVVGIGIALGFTFMNNDENDKQNNTNDKVVESNTNSDLTNIVNTASAAGNFDTLLQTATVAGLADTLANDGPFTIFAPTDDAFAKVPEDTLNALLDDPKLLAEVLKYHVVSGEVKASQVLNLDSAKTLEGQLLTIDTSNGVMVDNAKVITTDIMASNGVIHVIDTVLVPDNVTNELTQNQMKNIIDTAVDAGSFKTLVTAIQTAGLVDTLNGDGPFTVFAPTDDAFAKLGEETINGLLADKEELAKILTYHVVPGKVMAADVANLSNATTVQGGDVTINTDNGVMINESKVTTADIEASNGVIHVIDTVLIP